MNEFITKTEEKNEATGIRTFPVPFNSVEIKDKIFIETLQNKKEIINKACDFHAKGNIKEATKYYQYLINQGIYDHRVFSNYGNILNDLQKEILKKQQNIINI